MRTLWSGPEVSMSSTSVTFDKVTCSPRPYRGSIPIVVGGQSAQALSRAVRIGDGFFPLGASLSDVVAMVGRVRTECEAAGRDPASIEISAAAGGGGFDSVARRVERLAGAGVSRAMLPTGAPRDVAALGEALVARFG